MSQGYFKESSRYSAWIVISITSLFLLIIYFLGEKTSQETESLIYSYLIIVFVALLFLSMSIKLRVDNEAIEFAFFPFVWKKKRYRWDELSKVSVRKSKPLKEFGGWGYRIKPKKKAYTLYGKWGIDLQFKNGKSLFIGVQKQEELSQLLNTVIYPQNPHLKEGLSQSVI